MTVRLKSAEGIIEGLHPNQRREVYLPNGVSAVIYSLAETEGYKLFRGATLPTFEEALSKAPEDPKGGRGERVERGDGIQLADGVFAEAA